MQALPEAIAAAEASHRMVAHTAHSSLLLSFAPPLLHLAATPPPPFVWHRMANKNIWGHGSMRNPQVSLLSCRPVL